MDLKKIHSQSFEPFSYEDWLKLSQMDEEYTIGTLEGIDLAPLYYEVQQGHEFDSWPKQLKLSLNLIDGSWRQQVLETAQELGVKKCYLGDSDLSASFLHNQGASAVTELAYLVWSYANHSSDQAIIRLELALSSAFYLNTAKLRALRFMLEHLQSLKTQTTSFEIVATGSLREQSIVDPWNNILRNSFAFSAASWGGADEFALISYDCAFALANETAPSSFAIRNAITSALVLMEESHLDSVKDPFRGSYALETMTHQMVQAVQVILKEENLGLTRFKELAKQDCLAREEALCKRRYIMAGVNNFTDPKEDLVGIYNCDNIKLELPLIQGHRVHRLAQKFEELRMRLSLKQICVAIVYSPNYGAQSKKISFASNLFETAGLIPKTVSFEKFIAKNYSVVCVCVDDSELENLLGKINFSSKQVLFVVSKEKVKNAHNIYSGVDVYQTLTSLEKKL